MHAAARVAAADCREYCRLIERTVSLARQHNSAQPITADAAAAAAAAAAVGDDDD